MYQVLYRKYRPQLFSDVVGQEHITDTLMNELVSKRLSHAYLFTGSRGTGKTSCAKILAKAVNCKNPQNGNPCNQCEVCKGIDNGTVFDVLEIDAASNNGVDNIRDLREEANYSPSVGNYRVYIIDEVHMLSTGAFNALLKTLEEPPEHVMFILATTEIQKLPATILSRCQRFDFKRIQPESMAKRLSFVAEQENFTVTDDGAMLISRIADGAMRDALSILDQCAGRGKCVDAALVSMVCGIADKNYLYNLSDYIKAKDASSSLELIDTLHNSSCDMERLCTELINHFRNFLVARTVKNSRALIISTDDEYENINVKSHQFTIEEIIYILDLLQKSLESIKSGVNRRTEMEMTLIKLCEPSLEATSDALLNRMAILEQAVKNGVSDVKIQSNSPNPAKSEKAAICNIPKIDADLPQIQDFDLPFDDEQPEPVFDDKVNNEPHFDAAYVDEPPFDVENDTAPVERDDEKPISSENKENIEVKKDIPLTESPIIQDVVEIKDGEFPLWNDVLDRVAEIDIPLLGILNGSKAFIQNDFLLIDPANPTVKNFIAEKVHNHSVRRAIYEITGKKFRLGIYHKEQKVETAQKADPLDELIKNAQNIGIDITLK